MTKGDQFIIDPAQRCEDAPLRARVWHQRALVIIRSVPFYLHFQWFANLEATDAFLDPLDEIFVGFQGPDCPGCSAAFLPLHHDEG